MVTADGMLMLALTLVLCICPTEGEQSAVICARGFACCVDLEIRLQILPTSFESRENVLSYCAIQSCERQKHAIINIDAPLAYLNCDKACTYSNNERCIAPACLS